MPCVKDVLEILYYIAFIVLTWLIVHYARKTYVLQKTKSSKLSCGISVSKYSANKYEFNYDLEIYNYGDLLAQNVIIFVDGQRITTVDFIKPNESFVYPIGVVCQMVDENRVWLSSYDKELKKGENIVVDLKTNDKTTSFEVNTDILFALRPVQTATLEDVVNSLDNISEKLEIRQSLISKK